MVDPPPALDHLGGVALVHLTKTKPRERDLTSFAPCLQKNLYGATEENLVVMLRTALIKSFWEIEKSGTERTDRLVLSDEERLALNKMKHSLQYEKGRYRVAVPWKDEKLELPDTKPMALSRLRSTERNLKKDDRVAEDYKKTIQAYVEKGYLRKVPLDEQLPNNVWYLPHFPVLRMDKTTTTQAC